MKVDNIISAENRMLMDRLLQPVFYLSKDFRFIWANKFYCDYMGIPLEKLLSMEIAGVIPAEYESTLKGKFNSLNPEKGYFQNIYPSLLDDGSIYIEKWYNYASFDKNSEIEYFYCVGLNAQLDEKTSYRLNDRELISNTLIKNTLLGIIITIDDRINFVNKKTFEIFAMEPVPADNLTIGEFFNIVQDSLGTEFMHSRDAGDSAHSELALTRSDNSELWVSMIRKEQKDTELKTALYILEDITERKINERKTEKARENLVEIMKFAKVGYWEKDFENNCWLWSDELYEIYEIPPGTRITEEVLKRHLAEESMARRNKRISEVFKQDHPSKRYRIEYKIMTATGVDKWIAGESIYEKNPSGGHPKFYGWTQDITLRKNLEQTLRDAKSKAEESERLKSAFLANMSHEIRTPLNAILGFTDLLTMTDSDEEKEKYKKIVNNSSRLLLKIIDDVLDFSAIESGKFELYRESVSLVSILEAVKNIYSDRQGGEIELRISIPEEDFEFISDQERLKQVFINLINNAFKYTHEGFIDVACTLDTDKLLFTVKDTGIGIPDDLKEHIFERFYQVDSFSKGTGLGLSITKTIINQMGGTITVESEHGKGSEFSFSIPL